MRARAAISFVLAALAAVAPPARAAELPEAVVRVNRAPGAESCPTESEVISAVVASSRVARRERGPGKPVIDVGMERYGDVHFATIRVDGGARGVRTLQAEGASCDALRDAVVLALLVLLEREAEAPQPEPQSPRTPPEAPGGPRPSVHVAAGGAFTYWEPLRVFPALEAGFGGALGLWEAGARLQWSPARTIEGARGSVDVLAWGVTARLCHALLSREYWRVSGCGLGSLFALSGEGQGFDLPRRQVRPWWRAGLGLEASIALTRRLGLAAFGNVFATLKEENFSVGGLGEQYGTSLFTGHVGAELRVRLF